MGLDSKIQIIIVIRMLLCKEQHDHYIYIDCGISDTVSQSG